MSSKNMIFLKGYAQGSFSRGKDKGMINTLRAIHVAEKYHAGQFRKTGEPYIDHPTQVACELIALGLDDDILVAAALLHDVVEDCGVTYTQLRHDYHLDQEVLDEVTKVTKIKGTPVAVYYEGIDTWRSILLKICDRCHNVSTMVGGFTTQKMREYILETNEHVIPLCKLGKHLFPEYANQIFVMKYHLDSMTKAITYLLDDMEKSA